MWSPEYLRKLVNMTNKTLPQIASDAGIGLGTLRMAMGGRYTPSADVLYLLADYFNVSLDELVGRKPVSEDYAERFKNGLRNSYEQSIWTRRPPLENVSYSAPWPYNLLDDIYDEHVVTVLTKDQEDGLMKAISTLSDREQEIVLLYYRDGLNGNELSIKYGVLRQRVNQILHKGVSKLRHPARKKYIEEGLEGFQKWSEKKAEVSNRWTVLSREKARLDDVEKSLKARAERLGAYKLDLDLDAVDKEKYEFLWIDVIPDLSVRSFNCLRRANIETIGQIISKFEDGSILKVRNLGRKSIQEIYGMLWKNGIKIKPTEEVARCLV